MKTHNSGQAHYVKLRFNPCWIKDCTDYTHKIKFIFPVEFIAIYISIYILLI